MKKSDRFSEFLQKYPKYEATSAIDELRAKDFTAENSTYLDYTGGGRYGKSQIEEHMKLLLNNSFGNPHSSNTPSQASTKLAEQSREAVLAFFNASSDEYDVVFTPNASGALRLVGESYPFSPKHSFLQLIDNHNSVNGIREFAKAKKAQFDVILSEKVTGALQNTAPGLFAYPAQSNFNGIQYPLAWIEEAHDRGWDVLLDAAAYVPTNKLDLGVYKPDFVTLSFYKMFGWPTGVGCLLARKDTLEKLQRPWFSGGTIWAAGGSGDWHILAPGGEAFEDGTINYLNLPAVKIGLDYLNKIGIDTIHNRVQLLTGWLLEQLAALTHANGTPLVEVYGSTVLIRRGGTIAFNFLTAEGEIVDERIVDQLANTYKIALRTGCFCNPGAGEMAFGVSTKILEKVEAARERKNFDHYMKLLGLKTGGAVRVSLGLFSNFDDVEAFLQFAELFKDSTFEELELPERKHC